MRTWRAAVGVLCLGGLGTLDVVPCGGSERPERVKSTPAPGSGGEPAAAPVVRDAAWLTKRYEEIRARFERDPDLAQDPGFASIRDDLKQLVAADAADKHLRANATLLLGALYEARGDKKLATDFYRHAAELIPDDAGPHMALALALHADGRHAEAVKAQERATGLDPDNLENYLALGEMRVKAGDNDGGAKAYAAYETRRKGLIDGLTLKRGSAYRKPPAERVLCAQLLAAAADTGTALALSYALETDPDASVREAVVRVMGVQRLTVYRSRLEKQLAKEPDTTVKEAVAWALGEVVRAPVEAKGGPEVPSAAPG